MRDTESGEREREGNTEAVWMKLIQLNTFREGRCIIALFNTEQFYFFVCNTDDFKWNKCQSFHLTKNE